MTYETFWIQIIQEHRETKAADDWRLGQRYFNRLAAQRPDIANELRGHPFLDPFFENKVGADTHEWVAARW